MIRYLLIKFYADYYTSVELYNEKVEFKTIVKKYNMALYKEPAGGSFDQLFEDWGV